MVCEFSVAYTDFLNVVPEESAEDLESRAEAAVEGDESFGPSQIIDDIPDPKSVTYIDYDNPFALVQDTSGAPHIAKLSTYAWVGCGDDIYVLECLGKGYIRIKQDEDEDGVKFCISRHSPSLMKFAEKSNFVAHFTQAAPEREAKLNFKKSYFYRPKRILTSDNLVDTVRGCDTYAKTKVCHGPMHLG